MPDGSNADICRKEALENNAEMLLADTEGCQIAEDFLEDKKIKLDSKLLLSGGIQKISDNEVIIYKSRWGAF